MFVSLQSKRPDQRRFTLVVYDPPSLPSTEAAHGIQQHPPQTPCEAVGDSEQAQGTSDSASASGRLEPPTSPLLLPRDASALDDDAALLPLLAPAPTASCVSSAVAPNTPRVPGFTSPQSALDDAASSGGADPDADAGHPQRKVSASSTVLRKTGIKCFADHELGCHLVRSLNDGHQVWAGKRRSFGLQRDARAAVATEEGIASLNSALASDAPYLFFTALLYYAAVQAEQMSFAQLFEHLQPYVPDPQARYRQVARAKYGCCDSSLPGGNGKCQAYFEGNVQVLRALPSLDVRLLYAGKLTLEDCRVPRIQRLARTDAIAMPAFARDGEAYIARLHRLGCQNGILSGPPPQRAKSGAGRKRVAQRSSQRPATVCSSSGRGAGAPAANVPGVTVTSEASPPQDPPRATTPEMTLLPAVNIGLGVLQQAEIHAAVSSARSASSWGPSARATSARSTTRHSEPRMEKGTPTAPPEAPVLPRSSFQLQGALPPLTSPLRPALRGSSALVKALAISRRSARALDL